MTLAKFNLRMKPLWIACSRRVIVASLAPTTNSESGTAETITGACAGPPGRRSSAPEQSWRLVDDTNRLEYEGFGRSRRR
jgi:hypothetical protein